MFSKIHTPREEIHPQKLKMVMEKKTKKHEWRCISNERWWLSSFSHVRFFGTCFLIKAVQDLTKLNGKKVKLTQQTFVTMVQSPNSVGNIFFCWIFVRPCKPTYKSHGWLLRKRGSAMERLVGFDHKCSTRWAYFQKSKGLTAYLQQLLHPKKTQMKPKKMAPLEEENRFL